MVASPPARPPGRPADPEARAARLSQILAGARAAFARRGFHAASLAEISAEAGVSVANVYQYVAAKDDLVLALIEAHLEADAAMIRGLAEAPSLAAGLDGIADWIAQAAPEADPHAIRLDILAETFRNPEIAAAARRTDSAMVDALSDIIAAAQVRGEAAPDADPRLAAATLIALFDGLLARLAVSPLTARDAADAFAGTAARLLGLKTLRDRSSSPKGPTHG